MGAKSEGMEKGEVVCEDARCNTFSFLQKENLC